MGINVLLEAEGGRVLGRVDDPAKVLARVLPAETDERYSLLRFIDPYGDTIFNGPQASQVAKEIVLLTKGLTDLDAIKALRQVRELARRCEDEPHLFLRFEGD